jgi:uncharacterized protein (DUF2384 family)
MVDSAQHSNFKPQKLAIAGFKAADRVLASWGCTTQQVQAILKLSKSSYHKFKSHPELTKLGDDQMERISHLLNMHAALRMVFSNPQNVSGFMDSPNNNDFFTGRAPLEIISSGRFSDLYEVTRRVSSLQGIPINSSIGSHFTEEQLLSELDSSGAELLALPIEGEHFF